MKAVLAADAVTKQFAKGDSATVALRDRKQTELAAFQRAMTRALADIHGNPAQTRSLLGQYLKGTDAKALDAVVPILRQEVPPTPEVQRASYDTARKFHLDSGLVRKAPTYENVLYGQSAVMR